jgi:acyl-CoA synthetase (AMP-forming)/AMP-acid ligase II
VVGVSLAVVAPSDTSLSAVKPLATGAIGEILARGPVVTDTYDALPAETARAKVTAESGAGSQELWHRMGDVGWLDAESRLWVLGRRAERVETADVVIYSEEVEPTFNAHSKVARCALIGIGSVGERVAALVVEPHAADWPRTIEDRQQFAKEFREMAVTAAEQKVTCVFFCRKLPVDVRHNAKIHRLTLARWASAGKLGKPVSLDLSPSKTIQG